jgi:large subunit ribosomal protein L18
MSVTAQYKRNLRIRRHRRVRVKVSGSPSRPRLAIFRSDKHLSLQVIDDVNGRTLASASTVEKSFGEKGSTVAAATKLGGILAERAKAAGVSQVVFDRGGFLYHGRIAAAAQGARDAGLDF